ncbi:MAG: M1 family metallopeptidase [Bacteroidia bacterium]|nr:M1 family metallopeptidase [Bacteroidia bacterium]
MNRMLFHTALLSAALSLPAVLPAQKVIQVIPLQMENIEGSYRYRYEDDYEDVYDYRNSYDVQRIYHGSAPRVNDILHIDLKITFDIPAARAGGEETLKVKPYNKPVDSLILDAKGMEIHEVALWNGSRKTALKFENTGYELKIALDRRYTKTETYQLIVRYTARPHELAQNAPLLDPYERGLYFIRPDEFFSKKPVQIWTQGETEANSVWLPMIDKPNERFTHTISMTVPETLSTLSNGLLRSTRKNAGGTRTDVWVNDKENAAYLVMMAAGDFAVVKDKWRAIETSYYVEKAYAADARDIFAHTGEMLTFFSDLLGTPYPWQKFDQIVVRDYVSGAMENTSAVVFGQFVQRHKNELSQHSNEGIVAHEMFHHWFGDLVTCESWANLPLNESFANYSEYLWFEHKYGRWKADEHNLDEKEQYFNEAESKREDLIRFDHSSRNDMFDSHSYAKGGRILHMLRYYLGSETFFEGLKLYLKTNAGKPVEAHQLRLAFEEVSGEDLNWFFNQWFFDSGHPSLVTTISESEEDAQVMSLTVTQNSSLSDGYYYRLPVAVDVYFSDGSKVREELLLETDYYTKDLKYDKTIVNVNFDAEKTLLGEISETKPLAYWEHQWKNAPLFEDKLRAMQNTVSEGSEVPVLAEALEGSSVALRMKALELLDESDGIREDVSRIYNRIEKDVYNTELNYELRVSMLESLQDYWGSTKALENYIRLVDDPQADVAAMALQMLTEENGELAQEKAATFENSEVSVMLAAVATVYSLKKTPGKFGFFKANLDGCYDLSDKYTFFNAYKKYVTRSRNFEELAYAEGVFSSMLKNECYSWLRYIAYSGISDIIGVYKKEQKSRPELKERISNLKNIYETHKNQERNEDILPYLEE